MEMGFIPITEFAEDSYYWNPAIFVGPASVVRKIPIAVSLAEVGEFIEGWRATDPQATAAYQEMLFYRQQNIETLRFELDDEHWQPPQEQNLPKLRNWRKRFVQPGDVVLNRTLPFRAALATTALYRHPIDANCIIIRCKKDDPALSFWIALCLNQPAYNSYLIAQARVGILSRITLDILSRLNIPALSADTHPLAIEVWDWNDARLENASILTRLKTEVEAYVQAQVSDRNMEFDEGKRDRLKQGLRFRAAAIEDSWLPRHVELSHHQQLLERELQWVRLGDLLADDNLSRARISVPPAGAPFVRLRDIKPDLTIDWASAIAWQQELPRSYQAPLTSGEVLVSTMVSSLGVAYVDKVPANDIYITDHLERLRFRETPGAWALLLQTSMVRTQLQRSAIGSVQQFATRASIQQLRLPMVERKRRIEWEEALMRHHQRKAALDAQWRDLWPRAQTLFDNAMSGRSGATHDARYI